MISRQADTAGVGFAGDTASGDRYQFRAKRERRLHNAKTAPFPLERCRLNLRELETAISGFLVALRL
ncbi:MAG: hypothetical protein KGI75_19310, partial [Rhizobiaceae bacterium]|nr:hypothetical protein [Rhizobiaceae bacterium]